MKKWGILVLLALIMVGAFFWWREAKSRRAGTTSARHIQPGTPSNQSITPGSSFDNSTEIEPATKTASTRGRRPYWDTEEEVQKPVSNTNKSNPPTVSDTVEEQEQPEEPSISTGTPMSTEIPVVIRVQWQEVASGYGSTLGIRADGSLWTWGRNTYGELGLGDTFNRTSPVQVGYGFDWKYVAYGWHKSFAIMTDGALWAWGNNQSGQLGFGDNQKRLFPDQIGADFDWSFVAVGISENLAIKDDGTLWLWGEDVNNSYGMKNRKQRFLPPVQFGSDRNWKLAKCGLGFIAGIKTDGTLWTWGVNDKGQLGLGDNKDRAAPVQVGSDKDWSYVTCGDKYCFALKSNGTLWAWGWNFYGQLALGYSTDYNYPIQVGTDSNWAGIADPKGHGMGIKTDGSIWVWGSNTYGELGLGNYGAGTERYLSTRLGYENNWLRIAVGDEESFAIKKDGSLWVWGDNTYGALGLGDSAIHRLYYAPVCVR